MTFLATAVSILDMCKLISAEFLSILILFASIRELVTANCLKVSVAFTLTAASMLIMFIAMAIEFLLMLSWPY